MATAEDDDNNNNNNDQAQVNAEWDAVASNWDTMAVGYANSLWKETVEPLLNDNNTKPAAQVVILDFGCGTGLLTERLVTRFAGDGDDKKSSGGGVDTRTTTVIAIDASPAMIQVLQQKQLGNNSNINVDIRHLILGDTSAAASTTKTREEFIETYQGTVDMIIASSVLTFIPSQDVPATLQALGRLLRPQTGRLVHSDWPEGSSMEGRLMSESRAEELYAMAGLEKESTSIQEYDMGEGFGMANVFVGIAVKKTS